MPQARTLRLHLHPGNREVAQDHREDEDVVQRQRALEQVAGEVLRAGLAALPRPEDGAERERHADPAERPERVLAHARDVPAGVDEQVERQHDDDDAGEDAPCPDRDVEVELVGFSGGSEQQGVFSGWWEKVSSALLQAGGAGPLSTVLTNATRRDYFPSRRSVAQFLHNVLIKQAARPGPGSGRRWRRAAAARFPRARWAAGSPGRRRPVRARRRTLQRGLGLPHTSGTIGMSSALTPSAARSVRAFAWSRPTSSTVHELEGSQRRADRRRRERGRVDHRARAVDEVVGGARVAADERAVGAERLAERADVMTSSGSPSSCTSPRPSAPITPVACASSTITRAPVSTSALRSATSPSMLKTASVTITSAPRAGPRRAGRRASAPARAGSRRRSRRG